MISRIIEKSDAAKGIMALVAMIPLLAVVLLISGFNTDTAYAFSFDPDNETAEYNHGFSWQMDSSTGKLTVTFPSNEDYENTFDGAPIDNTLEIPSEMAGAKVQTISSASPSNTIDAITTLIYPKSITSITVYTASGFPKLFTSLEEIAFPDDGKPFSLTSIGAVSRMAKASVFPTTLKRFNPGTIDGEQFDFIVPDSCTTLNYKACLGISISSLYIPSTVQTIQTGASAPFSGCKNLTRVKNETNQWIAFPDCPNIVSLDNTGSATEIPASACSGWVNLKEIEIPATITSIGASAFADCESLESLKIDGEELLTIGTSAFSGTKGLKTLTLPDSIQDIGPSAFAGCGIEKLRIPAHLWSGKSFSMSSGTSQDFLTATEVDTYGGGSTAKSAQIFTYAKLGVRSLVDSSLYNTALKEVDLSAYEQTYLPHYMFAGAASLSAVAIPSVVEQLGFGVFTDCESLQEVYVYNPNGVTVAETEGGSGSTGTGGSGWMVIYPGTFTRHDGSIPEGDGNVDVSDGYGDLEALTIYGVGNAENPLIAYADKHENYTFVPFVFLGDAGSSDSVKSKFGISMPANTITLADDGSVVAEFPYDEGISRTLKSGEGCTITYTLNGKETTNLTLPGTYTVTVEGDGQSVFGTYTDTFTVAEKPYEQMTVTDNDGTGITVSGSLSDDVASSKTEVVVSKLSEDAQDYKTLLTKIGDASKCLGVFDVALLVDDKEKHENFGNLKISFPIASEYANRYISVHHLHECEANAGWLETTEKLIPSDGKVELTVSCLSPFALEVGDAVPQAGEEPSQGDDQQGGDINNIVNNNFQPNQNVGSTGPDGTPMPRTGDELDLTSIATIAALAACVALFALYRRRVLAVESAVHVRAKHGR